MSFSIFLPSQASASPPISGSPATRERVTAENYSLFVLSTQRTTFSLDIPSDSWENEKATGQWPRVFKGSLWLQFSKLRVEPVLLIKHLMPLLFLLQRLLILLRSLFLPYPFVSSFFSFVILVVQPVVITIDIDTIPYFSQQSTEWKVKLCLSSTIASKESDLGTEGVRVKGSVRDDEVEERDGCRSKVKEMGKIVASFLVSLILGTGDEVEGDDEDEDKNDEYMARKRKQR
ncbi:hypothetical protein K435DRAFT_808493 [Dendrothele bispora CBS 962.96]|uniref:Uncharacterized protein n=1 Tax=Dendrothele bispora (strain CBS 962.96) TaxID=1314807 RepID=A0A4S8L1A4_DENBC|nr:hypothetical protein K435DRAFT_808493 [Dendrothele bispora CBS 962.96]